MGAGDFLNKLSEGVGEFTGALRESFTERAHQAQRHREQIYQKQAEWLAEFPTEVQPLVAKIHDLAWTSLRRALINVCGFPSHAMQQNLVQPYKMPRLTNGGIITAAFVWTEPTHARAVAQAGHRLGEFMSADLGEEIRTRVTELPGQGAVIRLSVSTGYHRTKRDGPTG